VITDAKRLACRDDVLNTAYLAPVLLCALVAMALTGGACGSKSKGGIPSAGSANRPVNCLGRILPGDKILQLAAPVQSIVKDLLVKRGSRVTRGQVLATFSNIDVAEAGVKQAEADVRTAEVLLSQARGAEKLSAIAAQEADVKRRKREREKAGIDVERARRLHGSGHITQNDLENAEVALERAAASLEESEKKLVALKTSRPTEIAIAERRLASARAALERATAELDLCRVRAPIDGVVIDIISWPGEAVSQRGVMCIGNTDSMMVEAEVYINDINRVRSGAVARVRGDGFAGELTGTVGEIVSQVGDNEIYRNDPFSYSDKRIVRVRIRLNDGARVSGLSNTQVNVTIEP
jgi:HlyD family secretion protein